MIRLRPSKKSADLVAEKLAEKVRQIELIVSPASLTEISKAVFTITAKRFLRDLSVTAIQDPKRYHHLYEWNSIGRFDKKLFLLRRSTAKYGDMILEIVPLQSTSVVPIPARLLEPGPTGKIVTAQHIFRDKMNIMENDIPVHIYTKRTIAFTPDGQQIVFVPKDRVISIMHPGGNSTTHALRDFAESWYSTKAMLVVSNSRLLEQIGSRVGQVVAQQDSTSAQVYAAIKFVTESYGSEISQI